MILLKKERYILDGNAVVNVVDQTSIELCIS